MTMIELKTFQNVLRQLTESGYKQLKMYLLQSMNTNSSLLLVPAAVANPHCCES